MLLTSNGRLASQSGFTLIEMMIAVTVIGILASIAAVSYQAQTRKSHLTNIYQEINHFRMPYQILIVEGAGVTEFSPSGLNMPAQTQYCQFTVNAPNKRGITTNAVTCTIQNLDYVQGETLSLDRATDSSWQCHASDGIPKSYLPQACR